MLTGGPGSGKNTVIEELRRRGYHCVDEVGRQIIKEQVDVGGNALPWGNKRRFRDLMQERSIETYESVREVSGPVFFDRGMPDLVGYSNLEGIPIGEDLKRAVDSNRCNSKVFIFPPWERVYKNDTERKQSFEIAIATYEAMVKAYSDIGYELRKMPRLKPKRITIWLIQSLANLGETFGTI